MWNKRNWFPILVFLIVVSSCKSKKPIAERMGKLEALSTNELITILGAQPFSGKNLLMKANGSVVFGGLTQRFKLEIRMVPDSIIWMDLADPTFGLKVARAKFTPDSVAYYSRLLRRADAGSFEKLSDMLGAPIDFKMLQNTLLGAPAVLPTAAVTSGVGVEHQYFVRGKAEQIQPIAILLIELLIDANHQKLSKQTIEKDGQILQAQYQSYRQIIENALPHDIQLQFITKGTRNALTIEVQQYEVNTSLKFPFNMPSNYEPL